MSAQTNDLTGIRVALLATDGFEEVELTDPRKALEDAGASVDVVAPAGNKTAKIHGWSHTDWGDEVDVDATLTQASVDQYDALMLPGGVMNPDKLRTIYEALDFVRTFFNDRKPVAAICHAPWTLIDAGVVAGRTLTAYHSIRTDLINAGAHVVNEAVVVDQGLITSRNPDDLAAFNQAMIAEFAKARKPADSGHLSSAKT